MQYDNDEIRWALARTAEFLPTLGSSVEAHTICATLNGQTGGTTVTVDCMGDGEESRYKLEFRSFREPETFVWNDDKHTWETP
jgi:hypothetical protein